MRDLDDLDRVDWPRLEHAYGDAADVPELLRAVHADDEDALGELFGSLCHQSRRFSASAAAVPYLTWIMLQPRRDQSTVVSMLGALGFLAIGDDEVYSFPRADEADGIGDVDAVTAYRAVEAEVLALLPLVAHTDPRTAAAATWLVSWFPALAADTLPAVRATACSTTAILARGLLGDDTLTPGGWPEAVAALCAGDTDWALDEVLGAAHRLRGPDLVDEGLPYFSGEVAGLLAATLRLAPPPRRPEAIRAVRILADRAQPSYRASVRAILDDLTARSP